MEAKEAVRALLDRLPEDCSMDDVLYHLYVLRAIERGQADVAAGRTLSHKQVERRTPQPVASRRRGVVWSAQARRHLDDDPFAEYQ